jgi:membrane associated rhomboid family serine protease
MGGFKFFPPVIKALLVSNVAIYFLLAFFGIFRIGDVSFSEIFDYFLPLYPIGSGFAVWQLVTYMFLHGGFMHLFFNMFALWMFGMELENLWGSRKFFWYYMACGIGAGLSNLFIAPLFAPVGPTVGASGAVYGVLIAFGVLFPDRPIFIFFLLPIRARYFVLLYIFLEIYAGVTGTSDGFAHFAHLGGATVGLIYLLAERRGFSFEKLFQKRKLRIVNNQRSNVSILSDDTKISDASYYDILGSDKGIDQARIDEILDKISQHGYQNLTEEEKKILFAASKKMN